MLALARWLFQKKLGIIRGFRASRSRCIGRCAPTIGQGKPCPYPDKSGLRSPIRIGELSAGDLPVAPTDADGRTPLLRHSSSPILLRVKLRRTWATKNTGLRRADVRPYDRAGQVYPPQEGPAPTCFLVCLCCRIPGARRAPLRIFSPALLQPAAWSRFPNTP